MYDLALRLSVEKKFKKLAKKDPKKLILIWKKIDEIIQDPHRYKNLRTPLNHLKRVHIDKSFVLIFSVDDNENLIIIEEYEHHDNVYF
jgi:YafQ family addiction module toxin component